MLAYTREISVAQSVVVSHFSIPQSSRCHVWLVAGDFGEALTKPNEPAPVFWNADRLRSVAKVAGR